MIKVLYIITSARKCGPIQQTLNNIKYLDRDKFEPYLISIYPENPEVSQLKYFVPLVKKHIFVLTSKIKIITNRTKALRKAVREINPDVIHSLGVFPDYAISRFVPEKQVMTLRNYVWDDYPKRLGKIRGTIMCLMQLDSFKRVGTVVACSQSLTEIYKERSNMEIGYVRNGVDTEKFIPNLRNKDSIRRQLGLPIHGKIFVYSGPLIPRKNHAFLIDAFLQYSGSASTRVYLLILGDGDLMKELVEKYGKNENILFKGNVLNILDYLHASDIYVSTSKSEGLPNSVLEAIATKLPVVLSDIPQHKELFDIDKNIGLAYKQNDIGDLVKQLSAIIELDRTESVDVNRFSAKTTSLNYQSLYIELNNKNKEKE